MNHLTCENQGIYRRLLLVESQQGISGEEEFEMNLGRRSWKPFSVPEIPLPYILAHTSSSSLSLKKIGHFPTSHLCITLFSSPLPAFQTLSFMRNHHGSDDFTSHRLMGTKNKQRRGPNRHADVRSETLGQSSGSPNSILPPIHTLPRAWRVLNGDQWEAPASAIGTML